MPNSVKRYEIRSARHGILGSRNGVTVGHLREFLAKVDAAGVGDDARVYINTNTHMRKDGVTDGIVAAETRVELP